MARARRAGVQAAFRYPVRVEVRRPRLDRSPSLQYLDAERLARASRAEFEFGHVQTSCCRHGVLAVVKKGLVTGLRVEGCADCTPLRLTPELEALLEAGRKRLRRGRARPFRPTPVAAFLNGVAYTIVEQPCTEVCITVGGYGVCIVCCGIPRWCGITIVTPGGSKAATAAP